MIPFIKILKGGSGSGYRNRPNTGREGKKGGSVARNRAHAKEIIANKPQIDVKNQYYSNNIRTPATMGEPEAVSLKRKKHLETLAAHAKELENLSTLRTRHGDANNYYRDLGLEEMRGKFLLMPEGPDKEAIRPKLIQAYKEAENGYPAYYQGIVDKVQATRKKIESLKYKIEDTYHSIYATPDSIKARNALTAISRKNDMSMLAEIDAIERKQRHIKAAEREYHDLRYSNAKLSPPIDAVNTDIDYQIAEKEREVNVLSEELADHIKEYTKLQKKSDDAAAKYIFTKGPTTTLPLKNLAWLTTEDKKWIMEGATKVQQMIGQDREWKTPIDVGYRSDIAGRAYFSNAKQNGQPMNSISLFANSNSRTMVHELGHALEEEHPEILKASQDFIAHRSAPQFRDSLARIYPGSGYDPSEITWKDNWLNDYIGKEYKDATEVMSMGLEYMAYEPTRFARLDPDHFHYVFNQLKKLQKGAGNG